MIIASLISCVLHRDITSGIIDHIDEEQCVVILENYETVFITSSKICSQLSEGDKIIFEMRKK